jgi:hypothetical protein
LFFFLKEVLQEKGIKLPFPLAKKSHVVFSLGERGGKELFFPLRRNGLLPFP